MLRSSIKREGHSGEQAYHALRRDRLDPIRPLNGDNHGSSPDAQDTIQSVPYRNVLSVLPGREDGMCSCSAED